MDIVSLKKYYALFLAYMIAGTITIAIIAYFFDIGGSVSTIIVFLAAMQTSSHFVKNNKRVPSPEEKKKLVCRSLLITLGFQLFLGVTALLLVSLGHPVAFLQDWFGKQSVSGIELSVIFGGVLLFLTLLFWGAFRWSYGGYAVRMLKVHEKHAAQS